MTYLIILVIAVLAVILWMLGRGGNRRFWKIAAALPDEAYDWFMSEACWVVINSESGAPSPQPRRDYTGPFFLRVPKLGGRNIKVYGLHDQIEESQSRFLERYAEPVELLLQVRRIGAAFGLLRWSVFLVVGGTLVYLAWRIPSLWIRSTAVYLLVGVIVAVGHIRSVASSSTFSSTRSG